MNIEISVKKILMIIGVLVVCSIAGSLKDYRDGKTYKTIKIGSQTWMAENLNYQMGESKCYDNKEGNCEKYGRLYTWVAAMNACPAGWRLPSEAEFESLLAAVGSSEDEKSLNLRAGSWKNGSDMFGFSALPAGYCYSDLNLKEFRALGIYTFRALGYYTNFWTSTERNGIYAYTLNIDDRFASVNNYDKNNGYSVRCLQKNELMTDVRDGKTYRTAPMPDGKVWMAENLNYQMGESKCYDDDPANCEKYGRLYTWDDAKKACPAGWRLPSEAEFGSLLAKVGSSKDEMSLNLRADNWENGSDMFGFSAHPAGIYYSGSKKFGYLGLGASFWSSSGSSSDYADRLWSSSGSSSGYAYRLYIYDDIAGVYSYVRSNGSSVRCLQD